MFDFIRNHQMNIMLVLCAACATMTVMLFLTKFLSKKRKWILIGMEINCEMSAENFKKFPGEEKTYAVIEKATAVSF